METAILELPMEEKELQGQALSLKERANLISVVDEVTYLMAGQFAQDIKNHKNKIIAYFKPLKDAAYKTHKSITQREAEELEPLNVADEKVRESITLYLDEQERIRKEKQAEEEIKKIKDAEKKQDKLLERAATAEAKGDLEKAEILLDKAEDVYPEPAIVPSVVQKTTKLNFGSITRKTDTQVTVTDQLLLIKAIAEKKAPVTIVEFKLGTIKTWVKTAGIKKGEIPGLLIEETSGISIR